MMVWFVGAVLLAGGAACKKKAEDQGGAAGSGGVSAPASPDNERWGVPGAAGAASTEGEPGAGGAGGGSGSVNAEAPGGPGLVAAPSGEVPRTPPCPVGEQAWDPTSPDPEAGDFTLDEALAGLAGTGQAIATIDTSFGAIRCRLASDLVPRAVANFVGLARGLRPWWDPCRKAWVEEPFYDGLTFHRVIPTFMAQGGDPRGNGTGGPGYEFASEVTPELLHDQGGTLAYANSGPDTNGSQFYITVGRRSQLDGGYVVFGYCENVDVVQKIVAVPRDQDDKPYQPVLMRRVTITREG
jgi:peptidyl-prolyl cis-trans isomerase A (cyclophilin A)